MTTHFVSFRRGILEHGLSWVIVRIEIDYHDRVTYFDADTFESAVEGVKLRKNRVLDFRVEFQIPEKRIATVKIRLFALSVSDPDSLSARPGKVEKELLPLFAPDEIDGTSPMCVVPCVLENIQTNSTPLAVGIYSFSIHRHLCEVADQWCFVELAGLVGAARESLVAARPELGDELLKGLSRPMKSLKAELRHPYFLFDEGRVETTPYVLGETLYFVHRFLGRSDIKEPYATVIEEF